MQKDDALQILQRLMDADLVVYAAPVYCQQVFERQMRYLGCRVVGRYVVGQCTTPAELGVRARETAVCMAVDIGRG